jgi:hypothetical protein
MASDDPQNPFETPAEETSGEVPASSSIPATAAVALFAGTLLVILQLVELG